VRQLCCPNWVSCCRFAPLQSMQRRCWKAGQFPSVAPGSRALHSNRAPRDHVCWLSPFARIVCRGRDRDFGALHTCAQVRSIWASSRTSSARSPSSGCSSSQPCSCCRRCDTFAPLLLCSPPVVVPSSCVPNSARLVLSLRVVLVCRVLRRVLRQDEYSGHVEAAATLSHVLV